MTLMLSFDKKYGGFYIYNGFTKRICLGWVAFTVIPLNESTLFDKSDACHKCDKHP